MPIETIHSEIDLRRLRHRVEEAATRAWESLRQLDDLPPLQRMAALRFTALGRHPIEDRALNLIEQVNQTFTYLASFAAAEEIIRRHPNALPIRLNLGTASGSDLESPSAGVAAEVFAAVNRHNNGKLALDIKKVVGTSARYKYVFYFCPGDDCARDRNDLLVELVPLSEEQTIGRGV